MNGATEIRQDLTVAQAEAAYKKAVTTMTAISADLQKRKASLVGEPTPEWEAQTKRMTAALTHANRICTVTKAALRSVNRRVNTATPGDLTTPDGLLHAVWHLLKKFDDRDWEPDEAQLVDALARWVQSNVVPPLEKP